MPETTSQPGDTGTSGIQIPQERFNEVLAKAREATERATAAEAKYQALLTAQAADAKRLEAIERRFAPEPSDEYEDPADKALAAVSALTKRLEEREKRETQEAERHGAAMQITAAIKKAGIEDTEAAQRRLAEAYGSSRYFGHEWDPEAAAASFRESEKKLAAALAAADHHNTDATRSALHGGGSPPAPATSPPPPRPTPFEEDYREKIAAWNQDMEQRVLAEARAAG